MQVDSDNISEVLPQILKSIHESDFVAFDCEFTGLVTQLQRIQGFFPNHIQFYQRIKETAYNFRIIQLGIAAFVYKDGNYHPKVYNIYVCPNTYVNNYNNVMVCQVESMEFLAKNQMNFKRTFQKGIKTKRLYCVDEIKQHQYHDFVQITPQKMFLSPLQNQIAKNIENNAFPAIQQNLKLEKIIDFRSKTILNYLKMKYPQMIIYEPKKKNNRFEMVTKFTPKIVKPQNVIELEQNNQFGKTLDPIFATIIQNKKPIVGHFPNLDIGLIYHNFLKDLPQSYDQFCFEINKVFPQIYDTKVLSRRIQKRVKGIKVDLSSLFKACFNPKLLKDYSSLNTQEVQLYLKQEHHHEAGYDALMTGCAFVGMANFIAQKKGQVHFAALQPDNKLLYSRFSKQVSINGNRYCSGALDYDKIILIQSISQKQYPEWKQVAKILSSYGSLSVHEDHQEIYYVFEEPQNINSIINEFKNFQLKPYTSRKIVKARNMYVTDKK